MHKRYKPFSQYLIIGALMPCLLSACSTAPLESKNSDSWIGKPISELRKQLDNEGELQQTASNQYVYAQRLRYQSRSVGADVSQRNRAFNSRLRTIGGDMSNNNTEVGGVRTISSGGFNVQFECTFTFTTDESGLIIAIDKDGNDC